MLGGHHAISAAVFLARDHRDFGHGGFSKSKKKLCAVANDAAKLLLRAGKKAGNIFKSDKRNVEGVAEPHKPGTLHGRVDIEAAGQNRRLIRHDPHTLAAQACKSHNHVSRELFVHFEQVALIDHTVNHLFDIVRLV